MFSEGEKLVLNHIKDEHYIFYDTLVLTRH